MQAVQASPQETAPPSPSPAAEKQESAATLPEKTPAPTVSTAGNGPSGPTPSGASAIGNELPVGQPTSASASTSVGDTGTKFAPAAIGPVAAKPAEPVVAPPVTTQPAAAPNPASPASPSPAPVAQPIFVAIPVIQRTVSARPAAALPPTPLPSLRPAATPVAGEANVPAASAQGPSVPTAAAGDGAEPSSPRVSPKSDQPAAMTTASPASSQPTAAAILPDSAEPKIVADKNLSFDQKTLNGTDTAKPVVPAVAAGVSAKPIPAAPDTSAAQSAPPAALSVGSGSPVSDTTDVAGAIKPPPAPPSPKFGTQEAPTIVAPPPRAPSAEGTASAPVVPALQAGSGGPPDALKPMPATSPQASAPVGGAPPMPALAPAMPEISAQAEKRGSISPPPNAVPPADNGSAEGKRLELARAIVAKLLPSDRYRTIMAAVMADTTANLIKEMQEPALAQSLAALGMVNGRADPPKMDDVIKVVEILDPTFHRRVSVATQAVTDGVLDVAAGLEPQIREALATSYARNFDKGQLKDILAFFDTPTGAVYASRALLMSNDPAVRDFGTQVMQAVMGAMPKIMDGAKAAVASLPQPRDPASLSDSERRRIAQLLGIDLDSH